MPRACQPLIPAQRRLLIEWAALLRFGQFSQFLSGGGG
jgi:hypothetical protein